MRQAVAPEALAATLQAELAGFTELGHILQLEQDCLLGTDPDTLVALSERKTRCVEQLAQIEERRGALLQAQGLPAGRAGIEQWLATQPQALREAWDRLTAAAASARAANQLNGRLIGTRLGHNQAALATLHSAAGHQSVYGPDGQSALQVANRDLGRA